MGDKNLFKDYFNKIVVGADFNDLFIIYTINMEDDKLTFIDYVNFGITCLGIDTTVCVTQESTITYNFHDMIYGMTTEFNDKIDKKEFFHNCFSQVDLELYKQALNSFYNARSVLLNMNSEFYHTYDEHVILDKYFEVLDYAEEITIGYSCKDIKCYEALDYYDEYKRLVRDKFNKIDNELKDLIKNPSFNLFKTNFEEADYIETFLYNVLSCREFTPKRRGETSKIRQLPNSNSIYIYNFDSDKVIFDNNKIKESILNLYKWTEKA